MLVREVVVAVLIMEDRSDARSDAEVEASEFREERGVKRMTGGREGGGGGGARRVVVVETVDDEEIERAVSRGEVGAERGGSVEGKTGEGVGLEPGLCGNLGGPCCCALALLIANPQSNESVVADMGLIAGVATFSNDSLRLFVSSVVPLLCRSMGYVDIKLLTDGLSTSIVPPSEERDTEWNEEIDDAGA